MKNFTFLIAVFLVCGSAFGQAPMNGLSWSNQSKAPLKPNLEQIRNDYQNRCHSGVRDNQWWLSFGLDMDAFNGGGVAVLSGNYLFPDSNVYVNFDDGSGGTVEGTPFVHELGDVMDPLSAIYQSVDGITLTDQDEYWIDSVGAYIAYNRMTDASVVDTMVVYLYEGAVSNSNNAVLPLYYYTGGSISTDYGVDTLFVAFMKYNHTLNKPSGSSSIKTFKIPLAEEDSSSFYYFKGFSVDNFHVPAGHKVAMAITFKPGYSYNPFDNIADTYNTFFFSSYEENGSGTFPLYLPEEYNVSSIVPTSVRYNIDAVGYNGLFIPSYAYTAPYSFEHHLFAYRVSDAVVGVDDPNLQVSSFNVTPNPSSDKSFISFDLKEQANVTIEVYDLAGKLIQSVFSGDMGKGTHQQYLDLSKFANGVYAVTLNAGSQSTSKKLVVSR